MKRLTWIGAVVLLFAVGLYFGLARFKGKWVGVDETVVEKFAREAGHAPRTPFINTDQGDLLLFFFLGAGTVGGFVGGYFFREIFPPRKEGDDASDV